MSRHNQRQLKRSRLGVYSIKNLVPSIDSEGITSETFPNSAFQVKAEIWPATSKRQVELYGSRINDISNMRITGQYEVTSNGITIKSNTIKQGDGVYVLADPANDDPDYRILSITPYQPVKIEIEKR